MSDTIETIGQYIAARESFIQTEAYAVLRQHGLSDTEAGELSERMIFGAATKFHDLQGERFRRLMKMRIPSERYLP